MTKKRNNPDTKKTLCKAIDAAYGIFKNGPVDADALRKDSNESGRGIPAS